MPRHLQNYSAQALSALRREREAQGHAIKLVFFDVDGTLVNSQKQIPESCAKEIQRIKAQGVRTAIASGRPLFACETLFQQYGLDDAGVFCTGAVVYDPQQKQTLAEHKLQENELNSLISLSRAAGLHLELYSNEMYFIEHNTEYTDYHTSYLKVAPVLDSFDAVTGCNALNKALIVAASKQEKQALQHIKQQLPTLRFYTGHGPDRPDIHFVSILANSACKARAFTRLCDYHQLEPANVMAIGDAQSDLAFIQAAGTGVAMGNANQALQTEADFVSAHVDEDGLALALRSLVGEA
ncbi:MAG: HAD family hydrolase [Pseudomonadales bacterium]|nr:HAD family hydrolase [Pseudomonadales bacterium]